MRRRAGPMVPVDAYRGRPAELCSRVNRMLVPPTNGEAMAGAVAASRATQPLRLPPLGWSSNCSRGKAFSAAGVERLC